VQVAAAYIQRPGNLAARAHKNIGHVLAYAAIPVFGVAGMWVVHARIEEVNVRALLWLIIIFLGYWFARGFMAITRGNIAVHVDSMMAAFIASSGPAVFRFYYFAIGLVTADNPFSLTLVVFVAVLTVSAELALVFSIAGRLRANYKPIVVYVAANLVAVALLPRSSGLSQF